MELTSQNKQTSTTPSSFGHSSANIVSSPKIFPSQIIPERRDHQTQAQPPYQHNQPNPHPSSHKPSRDPGPIPDPATVAALTVMNAASTPARSVSRSSPPPPGSATTSMPPVRYRECLKNHAASMGGNVVDGCGEFMPKGEEGTIEFLICAACECHRNFHRKEVEGEMHNASNSYYKTNGHSAALPPPQPVPTSFHPPQPTPLHQHHRHHHGFSISTSTTPIAPMMMSFGGGGGAAESSSEDLNIFHSHMHGQASMQHASSKKRFRTKFSQEQKKKMMEFADKLGWKMQKQDDQEVQQFCSQLGVKRKVFKVWMHNNKQAMKRKQM